MHATSISINFQNLCTSWFLGRNSTNFYTMSSSRFPIWWFRFRFRVFILASWQRFYQEPDCGLKEKGHLRKEQPRVRRLLEMLHFLRQFQLCRANITMRIKNMTRNLPSSLYIDDKVYLITYTGECSCGICIWLHMPLQEKCTLFFGNAQCHC